MSPSSKWNRMSDFQSGDTSSNLVGDTIRKSGRVVYCTCLENKRVERLREFKSHLFLHFLKWKVNRAGLWPHC